MELDPDHPLHDREMAGLLTVALEQTFLGVVITDAELQAPGPRILWANRRLLEMTGYTMAELRGSSPRILQGPETEPAVIQELRRALAAGESFQGETVNYRKDGIPYTVEWTISPVHTDDSGKPAYYVSFQNETTEKWQERRQRQQLSTALEQTADSVMITEPDGTIRYVNRAFENYTGYGRDEAIGRQPSLMKSGEHDAEFYRELWETIQAGQPFRATFTNRKRNGELFFEETTITPVQDETGRIRAYVSSGKDVTERVEMERQLREMAVTDPLTGLANRLRFEQTLEAELERSLRYDNPLSLVMFDIDHFKAVNDTHGHEAGDDVLRTLADCVNNQLRRSDALARWGGEEFLVLAPQVGAAEAAALAEKLRAAVAAQDFGLSDPVTASFGVAERAPGDTPKRLIRRADDALYAAKETGRNRVEVADGQVR
ncbi:sensor domain-containing diguanylate cyclase [Thiohalospira halophila]|nr:GGDEF domain-containing protein [Thiohalospira halophila]